jgi:hypothetical protein
MEAEGRTERELLSDDRLRGDYETTSCDDCAADIFGYRSPYGDRCLRCSAFKGLEHLEGLQLGKPGAVAQFETARDTILEYLKHAERVVAR